MTTIKPYVNPEAKDSEYLDLSTEEFEVQLSKRKLSASGKFSELIVVVKRHDEYVYNKSITTIWDLEQAVCFLKHLLSLGEMELANLANFLLLDIKVFNHLTALTGDRENKEKSEMIRSPHRNMALSTFLSALALADELNTSILNK